MKSFLKIFPKREQTYFESIAVLLIGIIGIGHLPVLKGLEPDILSNKPKYEESSVTICPASWELISLPTERTIFSADFINSNDGWAVGFDGVYHWQSGEWRLAFNPRDVRIYDVKMLSANDGWMVGSGGRIFRWDGSEWRGIPSPVESEYIIQKLFFLSPEEGWAVGGYSIPTSDNGLSAKRDRVLIHWNGKEWRKIDLSPGGPMTGELLSLALVSSNVGWAVGEGNITRINNGKWEDYHIQDGKETGYSFQSISILNAENIWMAGYRYPTFPNLDNPGELFHWDGSQWSEESNVKYPLLTITVPEEKFGLAGGGDVFSTRATSLLLCWNGKEWQAIKSPSKYPLQYIWAKSAQEIWLFAGGNGVDSGDKGEVFRYIASGSCTKLPSPTVKPSAIATIALETSSFSDDTTKEPVRSSNDFRLNDLIFPAAGVAAFLIVITAYLFIRHKAKAPHKK